MQDPKCAQIAHSDLHVLEVDEDCVCMSDFIKKQLGVAKFINGHAFYEFKKKEDLRYYKEIVLFPKDKREVLQHYWCILVVHNVLWLDNKVNIYNLTSNSQFTCHFVQLSMLKSKVDQFYRIPGAPNDDVSPPAVESVRVFLQSTSHGARCLKRGDTVLYKKYFSYIDSII